MQFLRKKLKFIQDAMREQGIDMWVTFTLLGPRWPNRYGKQGEKLVQKDIVFTIEPSVTSEFGTCNLEQDVLVTSNGYRELSKPQHDIIRVGS